ncbi:hypothetical protein [Gilvimarinus xylanilyticus]|uniref:Uncharacterized protein n=1 Tax=Gilvimarinus xylanilyticus TaxID=2944139 RepID=A0A9X2I3Z0_9GAMM|nr:hypothetical protein [Gilvimarinus xylanilyticus]MCP8899017.1 hypothetical protein [Gilvimarinus xylanilyticus]
MIATSWLVEQRPLIYLKEPASVSGENPRKLAKVAKTTTVPYTVTARPGVGTLVGKDSYYDYYELDRNLDLDYTGQRGSKGGVAINRTDVLEPYRLYWYPDTTPGKIATAPVEELVYETGGENGTLLEFDGQGRTITYLGMSGGQLNFVYKEYFNRTIRSAFTQEFSFDYQPDKEYRYKTARFTVHSANSNDIDYTVHSYFGDE